MSNEEFERYKEFILGQQAQFAANMQAHDERLARNEELVRQIGERMIQLEDVVNRLAAAALAGFKDVNAKIDALVDSDIRLEDTQKQLSASFARLAEAQARTEANQARTDAALRNLIDTVERYINERRGRTGKNSDE